MKKRNLMRAMDRYHRLYRRYIMELKTLNIPQTANLHWMIRQGFSDTEIKNQLGIPWTTIKVFREAYNYKFFV